MIQRDQLILAYEERIENLEMQRRTLRDCLADMYLEYVTNRDIPKAVLARATQALDTMAANKEHQPPT